METPVLPSTGALIASHVEEDKTPKSEKANKSPPALSATPLSKRPHSERFAHPALSFPAPSPSPALKILRSGVHHQPIVDDIAALEVPIILPLRPRVSDAITPAHEVLTSPNTKDANRTRILCVDDNPINLRLLKSYLERLNYVDITCATDGAVAFEAVRCHPDGFELIFMDLTMPVLDGFACTTLTRGLEKLMQRMPRAPVTPRSEGLGNTGEGEKQQDRATLTNRKIYDGRALIVALTGLASQKDQDAASAAGADFFITKPLRLVRLKELLKEWGFALPLG